MYHLIGQQKLKNINLLSKSQQRIRYIKSKYNLNFNIY